MSLHHKHATAESTGSKQNGPCAAEYDEESDYAEDFAQDPEYALDNESTDFYQVDVSWIEQADAQNLNSNEQALAWLEQSNDDSDESYDRYEFGTTNSLDGQDAFTAELSNALFDEPADPAAIQTVVSSVTQMIPAIIRAVGQHPHAREIFEEQAGMPFEQVDPDDSEAWPAIIGALASAVPAIVGAVTQAVRGNQRRQAPSRAQQPSRPSRRTAHRSPCPPANRRENWPEQDDAEAIQLAALIPVLMQLLPVIIPLINQMIPLLTKALPTLLSSFGKMAGSSKKTGKESAFTTESDATYANVAACQTEAVLGGAADIDIESADLN